MSSALRTDVRQVSAKRETWVDVAKGIAILLVVAHHAVQMMDAAGWGWVPLSQANAALKSFRMPLFFFASGLFALSAMSRPWRVLLRSKVALFLYLYVLWSCIRSIFFSFVPWSLGDNEPLLQIWRVLVLPSTGLWYLYALGLYFMAARFLAPLRPGHQILVAMVVSAPAASGFVASENWALNSMMTNFMFFMIAIHSRRIATRMASAPSPVALAAFGVGWTILTLAAYFADAGSYSPLRVPLSLLAIGAGIHLSAILDRWIVGTLLRYMGGRTLRIYLLHVMVLGALFALLPPAPISHPVASVAILACAISLAVFTSLLAGHALRHAGWLWGLGYSRDLEVGPIRDRGI